MPFKRFYRSANEFVVAHLRETADLLDDHKLHVAADNVTRIAAGILKGTRVASDWENEQENRYFGGGPFQDNDGEDDEDNIGQPSRRSDDDQYSQYGEDASMMADTSAEMRRDLEVRGYSVPQNISVDKLQSLHHLVTGDEEYGVNDWERNRSAHGEPLYHPGGY